MNTAPEKSCPTKRCPKRALKIGLTISFAVTAIVSYYAPEYGHIVAVVGASSNTVWLWEI